MAGNTLLWPRGGGVPRSSHRRVKLLKAWCVESRWCGSLNSNWSRLCSIPQSPVSLCKVHHVPCDSSAVDSNPSICVNRSFVWIKLIKPIAYLSWQHHIHFSMIDAVIHVCLVRATLRVGFTRRKDTTRKLKCRPLKFDAYKAWHWYYRKLWLVSFSFFDYCGRNFNNAYTDMTISSKHP